MDLKELERFLKICRKQGVNEITFGEVTVKFGDLPTKADSSAEEIDTPDALTSDELIYMAVQNAGSA